MPKALSVILGDFDRARAADTAVALRDRGFAVEVQDSGAGVLERCRQNPPDVVVLELLLPRGSGFEVLKALKEDGETSSVRTLVQVDEGDDYGYQRARLLGADEIVRRPLSADRLAEVVRQVAAGTRRPTTATMALSGVIDALEQRARTENPLLAHITDPLTGLYNRAYTDLKLADEVKKARRFHLPLTCCVVALDEKGALATGDEPSELRRLANEVAGILLCECRDIDHLAYVPDRHFICVLPHTDVPGATTMSERILRAIEDRGFEVPGTAATLTASVGIATLTEGELETADDLVRRAKDALATSRQWGGNRITVWSQGPERART